MKLPIQVTFRNMEEGGLEEYVREQAAKLERYFQGITSCRVIMEMQSRHRHGNTYHVRIDLGVPGGELVVKHEPDIHSTLQELETRQAGKRTESGKRYKNPRRAILAAFSEMRRRLQDYVRTRRGKVKQHVEPQAEGSVESLFPEEGYGFLRTRDGREVYFQHDAVLNGHFDQLRIGSAVRFVEGKGEKGAQASTVRVVHPGKQSQAAAESEVVRRRSRSATSGD